MADGMKVVVYYIWMCNKRKWSQRCDGRLSFLRVSSCRQREKEVWIAKILEKRLFGIRALFFYFLFKKDGIWIRFWLVNSQKTSFHICWITYFVFFYFVKKRWNLNWFVTCVLTKRRLFTFAGLRTLFFFILLKKDGIWIGLWLEFSRKDVFSHLLSTLARTCPCPDLAMDYPSWHHMRGSAFASGGFHRAVAAACGEGHLAS